jgi:hypothetical protein
MVRHGRRPDIVRCSDGSGRRIEIMLFRLSMLAKRLLKRRKGSGLSPLAATSLLLGLVTMGAAATRAVLSSRWPAHWPIDERSSVRYVSQADSPLRLYRDVTQERYGRSFPGLRPVEGSLLLAAPAASAPPVDALLAQVDPSAVALLLAPETARAAIDPPTSPALPEPVLPAPASQQPTNKPRPVPWAESTTTAEGAPFFAPGTIDEGPSEIAVPTAAAPEGPAPAAKGASKDADSAAAQAKGTADVYRFEVNRPLKPITQQVTTSLAEPQGQYHPDDLDKDEKPLQRAHNLFAAEVPQPHGLGGIRARPWADRSFAWEASGLCHRPLYFQEVNLERYGYSFPLAQPVVSAAHFFGRIPALPYLMTVDAPHRCVYTLGHYRPGSCAPLAWHLVPFDPLAAAAQAGAVTGLVYLIP